MRLGTMLGGKAWQALNTASKEQRRAQERKRRAEYDRIRRRRELDDAGFRGPKWVSE